MNFEKPTPEEMEKARELGRAVEEAQIDLIVYLKDLRGKYKAPAGWGIAPSGEWVPPQPQTGR